jgi:hypothetical protein
MPATLDPTSLDFEVDSIMQIQQSFEPPNWRHHTNGAAVLIDLKGGLANLVFSRPYLRHLFRYYVL